MCWWYASARRMPMGCPHKLNWLANFLIGYWLSPGPRWENPSSEKKSQLFKTLHIWGFGSQKWKKCETTLRGVGKKKPKWWLKPKSFKCMKLEPLVHVIENEIKDLLLHIPCVFVELFPTSSSTGLSITAGLSNHLAQVRLARSDFLILSRTHELMLHFALIIKCKQTIVWSQPHTPVHMCAQPKHLPAAHVWSTPSRLLTSLINNSSI